jgi:hypothetical protein
VTDDLRLGIVLLRLREAQLWLEPVRRIQFLEYLQSLDDALNEHKQKGTVVGDPVYLRIFDQLAGDLRTIGIGRDQIPAYAQEYGH